MHVQYIYLHLPNVSLNVHLRVLTLTNHKKNWLETALMPSSSNKLDNYRKKEEKKRCKIKTKRKKGNSKSLFLINVIINGNIRDFFYFKTQKYFQTTFFFTFFLSNLEKYLQIWTFFLTLGFESWSL